MSAEIVGRSIVNVRRQLTKSIRLLKSKKCWSKTPCKTISIGVRRQHRLVLEL